MDSKELEIKISENIVNDEKSVYWKSIEMIYIYFKIKKRYIYNNAL